MANGDDTLMDKQGFLNFYFKPCDDITDEVTSGRLNAFVEGHNKNVITDVVGAGYFRQNRRGKTLILTAPPAPSVTRPALWVSDASTGSTAQIMVKSGAFNGSIIPTIGGNPIDTMIGSPPVFPTLILTSGDTKVWFELTYDNTNTLISVLINHGTTIPSPTIISGAAGTDYYGLSTVTVITGSRASVNPLNDYVSGPQGYSQCLATSQCWLK